MKKTEKLIPPQRRTHPGEQTVFFDFGKHAFAILTAEVVSDKKQEIVLAVGEVLKEGRIHPEPGGSRIYQEEKFSLSIGVNHVEMKMSHSSYNDGTLQLEPNAVPFRYAEIRGDVQILQVFQKAYFGRFDDEASDFKSDSSNLDDIWEFCKYTMKATTPFGVFIDGNRERQAYEGDTYINQLGYFVCTSDSEIARNTVERLFAYPTWPTEWRLSMVPIIHDYALYTGDLESVAQWYELLKENLLLEGINGAGLLDPALIRTAKKSLGIGNVIIPIRDLVDWPQSERDGYEMGTVNLVPNCWHYMALCRMAEIARLLNKEEEALFYGEMAARSRKAIRKSFLKKGLFVDNPQSEHTALHSCIFPVLWGLAEEEEKQKSLELLQTKGMACSVFAAQFLLECCFKNGLPDYGFDLILSKGKRSWNNMISCGATIAMEAWDDSFKPNQDWNHPWGAAPGNIIIRFIAGIQPLEPGFKKFSVAPMPGRLRYFSAETPTPFGKITLKMVCPGSYELTVPPNTCAVYRGREFCSGKHLLD